MARNSRLSSVLFASILALLSGAGLAAEEPGLPVELRQQLLLRQYQQALPELERIAASGNAEAQYQLALYRLEGNGGASDPGEAVDLLGESSAAGHAKANYLLGSMYYHGKVVQKNVKAAKYHLFAAAQQDHRLARDLLRRIDGLDQTPEIGADQAQEQLWSAARAGAVDRAEGALKRRANINAENLNGETALIIAINSRQETMAVWLIEHGASPDQADPSGDGPLHLAAREGMAQASAGLITASARIDATNRDGRTPLMLAIIQHHADVAEQLLAAGASPDQPDAQGRSARDLAAHLGDPRMARLIGPRRDATASSHDQRLALLRNQITQRGSLYQGWPVAAAAVAQDEVDLALSLVNGGDDPWLPAPNGASAMYLAVERDHPALARAMLEVSPVRDQRRQTEAMKLLALAAIRDDEQLVADLLETLPADSGSLLPIDQTPLWLAIESKSTAVAMRLMEWQEPDRRQDARGMNLLLLASQQGMASVILGLRSRGFDLDTSDRTGRTAVWLAADQGHCDLLAMLLARGAGVDSADVDGQTPLIRSVLAGAPDCVGRTIEAGADINHQTRSGNTALMLAAESSPAIVGQLLSADADYEIRNTSSNTALMLAASADCVQCADALIAAGANARRRNARGVSAMDLATDNPALLAAMRR